MKASCMFSFNLTNKEFVNAIINFNELSLNFLKPLSLMSLSKHTFVLRFLYGLVSRENK